MVSSHCYMWINLTAGYQKPMAFSTLWSLVFPCPIWSPLAAYASEDQKALWEVGWKDNWYKKFWNPCISHGFLKTSHILCIKGHFHLQRQHCSQHWVKYVRPFQRYLGNERATPLLPSSHKKVHPRSYMVILNRKLSFTILSQCGLADLKSVTGNMKWALGWEM